MDLTVEGEGLGELDLGDSEVLEESESIHVSTRVSRRRRSIDLMDPTESSSIHFLKQPMMMMALAHLIAAGLLVLYSSYGDFLNRNLTLI